MEINGRHYSLWGKFIKRKKEWIGGTLEDFGDSMDIALGYTGTKGIITDIVLRPNGKDSAFFEVLSDGWGCGFDVRSGGVSGDPNNEEGWITFSGYGGHKWRIKQCKPSTQF